MELKITKKDILKSMNINLVQSHKNYLLNKNKNLSSTNNNNLSDDESDEKLEKKLNQINTVSGSLDSFTSNLINNVDKNIIIINNNKNNKSLNILNNNDGILNIIDSCSIKYDASVYNDKDLIMVGDATNEFLKNSSNNIEINQKNCVSSSTKLEETTNNKPLVLVRFESNESFLLSLHENEHKNNMTIKNLKSTSEMKHIFEMDRY